MKKILCLCLCTILFAGVVFAQQITKFAVVDTTRVYNAYYRDSSAVRNYEQKKNEFQAEIDKLSEELKKMQVRKADLMKSGDDTGALRLESDMTKRAAYLAEYTKAKNIELDNMKRQLGTSDEFYSRLYSVIERIAEAEGYSMVLSLQDANAVLWYSPAVDITDKIISSVASAGY